MNFIIVLVIVLNWFNLITSLNVLLLRVKMIGDHVPGVEKVCHGFMIPPEEELLLALVLEVVGGRHGLQIFPALIRKEEEEDPLVDADERQLETIPPNIKWRHL